MLSICSAGFSTTHPESQQVGGQTHAHGQQVQQGDEEVGGGRLDLLEGLLSERGAVALGHQVEAPQNCWAHHAFDLFT